MSVYRLEVHAGGVSRTTDPGTNVQEWLASYQLNAFDGSGGHGSLGTSNAFGIVIGLFEEASSPGAGGLFCQAIPLAQLDPNDGWVDFGGSPGEWSRIPLPYMGAWGSSGFYGSVSALGDASWFTAGGTLAIEKDTVGQTLTFISPAGTITIPWSSLMIHSAPFAPDHPLAIDNSGWAVAEISAGLGMSNPSPSPSTTQIDWTNLFFKDGGVTTGGHALSTPDPGMWDPAVPAIFQIDPFVAPGGFAAPLTQTQLASVYRLAITGTDSGFGPDQGPGTIWYLPQAFSVRAGHVTAAEKAPDYGVMWRAAAKPGAPTALIVARSFDGGHSWIEYTAYSLGGTNNTSPSLNWTLGRLYLTWHDGTNVLTSYSTDGGANWSMPITIPGAGANPVHLIDKDSGLGWYFYTDGSDLKAKRSADGGKTFIDPGAIVVQTGIGAQTVGASFTPDRGIAVSYFDASNLNSWTVLKSHNMGVTWS